MPTWHTTLVIPTRLMSPMMSAGPRTQPTRQPISRSSLDADPTVMTRSCRSGWLAGLGWRDSLALGALMNARALMELIVIKIGLDAGVINQQAFTMLLVMAIATTVMTGPLLSLFLGRRAGAYPARASTTPP